MTPSFRHQPETLATIRADLEKKAAAHCAKLGSPEDFNRITRDELSETNPDPDRQPHHDAARRAARHFVPRGDRQLHEFLQLNPDLSATIRTREDATTFLEALALQIYAAQFAAHERRVAAERGQQAERRTGLERAASSVAGKPAISSLEATPPTTESPSSELPPAAEPRPWWSSHLRMLGECDGPVRPGF